MNHYTIKTSLVTIRKVLTVKAEIVICTGQGHNSFKTMAYQPNKTFKENCILTARLLACELQLPLQRWQLNLLECEDMAFFSTAESVECLQF